MEVVTGFLQSYSWGRTDGLSQWFGPTGSEQAELWFGTHPHGRSPRRDGGVSAAEPAQLLTKLLAAERPLSLQVHPPADLAERMFRSQSADPALPQLLSDPFAKAEMLVALEPFSVLMNLRDPRLSARILADVAPAAGAVESLRSGDVKAAIRSLLAIPPAVIDAQETAVISAMAETGFSAFDIEVMKIVFDTYPGDPGVFVATLMEHRILQPGEALYVPPGVLHAYVNGLGLEVMTSSDNVLRLGLTRKTVAVDQALRALSVDAQAEVVTAQVIDGRHTYAPAAAPFTVDVVDDALLTAAPGIDRSVVCLSGTTVVSTPDTTTTLRDGEAVLAFTDDPALTVTAAGRTVVVAQTIQQGA